MKVIKSIFILVLILFISCKSGNDKKAIQSVADEKQILSDTARFRKGARDNYLLDNTSNQDNGPVYMFCEKMPEFPGGETAFTDYLKSKIRYSKVAVSDKIEGRVKVKFIVSSSGEIIGTQIIKGIEKDLDDQCLKAISTMPKWKPGMIDNKPVSVSYNIPIRFVLKKSENLSGYYILP